MTVPERAIREDVSTWCIWTKTGRRPSFFHPTQEKAEQEAQRLARKVPGKKFLVMQVVSKFVAEPAQAGTHPKGGDAKQAPGESLSDAVAEGHAPTPSDPSIHTPRKA